MRDACNWCQTRARDSTSALNVARVHLTSMSLWLQTDVAKVELVGPSSVGTAHVPKIAVRLGIPD